MPMNRPLSCIRWNKHLIQLIIEWWIDFMVTWVRIHDSCKIERCSNDDIRDITSEIHLINKYQSYMKVVLSLIKKWNQWLRCNSRSIHFLVGAEFEIKLTCKSCLKKCICIQNTVQYKTQYYNPKPPI